MENFSFHNTTAIHFGKGQISAIATAIPKDKKVLMLYGGGSIKTNTVYDQVKSALKNHNYDEFSGIEPNPQYDTLMRAVEKVKAEGFDYLLAVGGGSVLDGVKFIAAAAPYKGQDHWDILSKNENITTAIPIGCVLTIPATGSETNCGSVVSKGKEKLFFASPLVRPKFAVLDPAVTITLSKRQTANGVIDAFVHVMEQYLTYPVDAKVQDRFSEGLLLTLIEEGPKAMTNSNNIPARANIMWCATLGLNDLIGLGVPQDWTSHMIGHELTGYFGIDHARSLSIVLPAVMKHRRKQKEQKLLQYAQRVFNIKEGSKDQIIDDAIAKTVDFFKLMESPTSLADVNLGKEAIDTVIASLESHGRVKLGEKGEVNLEESRKILETAL